MGLAITSPQGRVAMPIEELAPLIADMAAADDLGQRNAILDRILPGGHTPDPDPNWAWIRVLYLRAPYGAGATPITRAETGGSVTMDTGSGAYEEHDPSVASNWIADRVVSAHWQPDLRSVRVGR